MVSYRFVPISSQKGVLFFETPGTVGHNSSGTVLKFLLHLQPSPPRPNSSSGGAVQRYHDTFYRECPVAVTSWHI